MPVLRGELAREAGGLVVGNDQGVAIVELPHSLVYVARPVWAVANESDHSASPPGGSWRRQSSRQSGQSAAASSLSGRPSKARNTR